MKIKKWFFIGGTILVACTLLIYNVLYVNIKTITVREKEIVSSKIDDNLDGLVVVFFSDLHYGTAIKDKEVQKLKDLINSFDPDVVLFGGDLVDDSDAYVFAQDEKDAFVKNLKDIKAKYGKFAVYGNHDLGSESIKNEATNILASADFEILTNASTKVYRGESYINIVGIDSLVLGSPDIQKAYSDVDHGNFTISLCHTPDIFDDINDTDLLLAGHSHGGQIYLPLVDAFYRPKGATNYFKGEYYRDDMKLDITNGVGTTYFDARFLSDSEIVVYKLVSAS